MNGTIHEIDAQRARWLSYRAAQELARAGGDRFACGGLGRLVDGLDVRLLFLPADPDGDTVPLDREVLAWLKERRRSPYGGPYPTWGNMERGTNGALVLYDQYRADEGWTKYLALHRHGGIEIGVGRYAFNIGEIRIFPLRSLVGLAWTAAALHAEVVDRWRLEGPFEITVALRRTSGATMGGFAEGWMEPQNGFGEFATCLDEHLLLRHEADAMVELKSFALGLGVRIEQAFGTVHRRHIAHRGEYEGRFDPRFTVI